MADVKVDWNNSFKTTWLKQNHLETILAAPMKYVNQNVREITESVSGLFFSVYACK